MKTWTSSAQRRHVKVLEDRKRAVRDNRALSSSPCGRKKTPCV